MTPISDPNFNSEVAPLVMAAGTKSFLILTMVSIKLLLAACH